MALAVQETIAALSTLLLLASVYVLAVAGQALLS